MICFQLFSAVFSRLQLSSDFNVICLIYFESVFISSAIIQQVVKVAAFLCSSSALRRVIRTQHIHSSAVVKKGLRSRPQRGAPPNKKESTVPGCSSSLSKTTTFNTFTLCSRGAAAAAVRCGGLFSARPAARWRCLAGCTAALSALMI